MSEVEYLRIFGPDKNQEVFNVKKFDSYDVPPKHGVQMVGGKDVKFTSPA
jgi:hypothetical protein